MLWLKPSASSLLFIAKNLVDVKGLITHRFRLKDFEKALETASNAAEKPIMVVVTK